MFWSLLGLTASEREARNSQYSRAATLPALFSSVSIRGRTSAACDYYEYQEVLKRR
jgi:hypothetical protein